MSLPTGVSRLRMSLNSAIISTMGQKVHQLIHVEQVKPKAEYNLHIKGCNEMKELSLATFGKHSQA